MLSRPRRISSVARDLPQAGLCQIVAFIVCLLLPPARLAPFRHELNRPCAAVGKDAAEKKTAPARNRACKRYAFAISALLQISCNNPLPRGGSIVSKFAAHPFRTARRSLRPGSSGSCRGRRGGD